MLRFLARYNFRSSLLVFLMAMAVVFIPRTAYSQQSSATVNGTVRDSSGAVIDGATITLTNLDTAVSRNSVTNRRATMCSSTFSPLLTR